MGAKVQQTGEATKSASLIVLDFVTGIEISTSPTNHPEPDICNELKGIYPKDFKFVGWHPWCRCIATAKTADDKQFDNYIDRMLAGEDVDGFHFEGEVTEMPECFTSWVRNNQERIASARTTPYFIADNYVNGDPGKGFKWMQETTRIPKLGDGHMLGREEEKVANAMYMIPSNNLKNTYTKAQIVNHEETERVLGISKGEDMNHEEANTDNENIDGKGKKAGQEYKDNCQCCVVTYELRRRGFNVKAAPHFDNEESIPFQLGEGKQSAWIGAQPQRVAAKNGVILEKDLNAHTRAVGRYHIEWDWQGRDKGHIITAERLPNGKLIIYDPQDSTYLSLDFLTKTNGSITITRVDNLRINTAIISEVVRAMQR